MLENTEGQSRETGNIEYTRHKKENTTQYVLDTTTRKHIQIT